MAPASPAVRLPAPHHLPPVPPPGCLRIAPLLPMPALLTGFGHDPWPLAAAAGIERAWFDDADHPVPFVAVGRLLELIERQTGAPHVGLLTGLHSGGEITGPVWTPAQTAPTVGAALAQIIRYLHLHDRGAVPVLWRTDSPALLGYVLHTPDVPASLHIYDGAAAICCNILRTLCGPRFTPLEVRLCRPPPADPAPWRAFFRARVRFGAEQTLVAFDARWLRHPLPGSDPQQHARWCTWLAAREAVADAGLASRLHQLLRRLLINGANADDTALPRVAGHLALHPRTLNRRLRTEGTTFRALMEAARFDVARQLLRDTRCPVADIAASLDYADAAAFTRAFHRWAGMPPAAWRNARAVG